MTEQEEIMHLYNQIMNSWNLVLMLSTWLGLRIVRQVLPEVFAKRPAREPLWRKLPNRLMPVYPIVICTVFYVMIPGPWVDDTLSLWQRALLGTLCGSVAGHGHAVLSRMLPEPLRAVLMGSTPSSVPVQSQPPTDEDAPVA